MRHTITHLAIATCLFIGMSWSPAHAAVSTFADGIAVGGTGLSSGLILDVTGKIGASEYCAADGSSCVAAGAIGSLWSSNGNKIYNNNSDNVGIGNSNPLQKLHVSGNIRSDGRHIYLGGGQDLYGDNGAYLYYDSNHSSVSGIVMRDAQNDVYGYLYGGQGDVFGLLDGDADWAVHIVKDNFTGFRVNDDEKMRLTSTGRLGIGTNSPSYTLHAVSENSSSPTAIFTGGSSVGAANAVSGQLLLGSNPSWQGSISYNGSAGDLYFDNTWNSNDGDIRFRTKTAGTPIDALTITGEGKVGIGDSTPDTGLTLDIEGKVGASEYCDENMDHCVDASKSGWAYVSSQVSHPGNGQTVTFQHGLGYQPLDVQLDLVNVTAEGGYSPGDRLYNLPNYIAYGDRHHDFGLAIYSEGTTSVKVKISGHGLIVGKKTNVDHYSFSPTPANWEFVLKAR